MCAWWKKKFQCLAWVGRTACSGCVLSVLKRLGHSVSITFWLANGFPTPLLWLKTAATTPDTRHLARFSQQLTSTSEAVCHVLTGPAGLGFTVASRLGFVCCPTFGPWRQLTWHHSPAPAGRFRPKVLHAFLPEASQALSWKGERRRRNARRRVPRMFGPCLGTWPCDQFHSRSHVIRKILLLLET
jgi:hypothetical protein